MLVNLTDYSDEPLHQQISRQIRGLVLGGQLQVGQSLPSIRGFAKDHRVSVITVQRAYEDLDREGLIQARRGKGFFVAAVPDRDQRSKESFQTGLAPLLAQALAEGITPAQILGWVREALDK